MKFIETVTAKFCDCIQLSKIALDQKQKVE